MAAHVEVEVAQRVRHRRQVADLAGDVEHDVGVGDQPRRRAASPMSATTMLDVPSAVDVAPVAAVLGDERVDDRARRPRREASGGPDWSR